MGGSSKAQTIGYRYCLGMHAILHHGEADNISRLYFDDRTGWEGLATGGTTIAVDAPNLYGGDDREGGVSGLVDFETGSATQTVNPYLLQVLGPYTPAYRGVTGLVYRGGGSPQRSVGGGSFVGNVITSVLSGIASAIRNFYFGNNPYLKTVGARSKRIHKRQDGLLQWYDPKAEIGELTDYEIPGVTGWEYQIVPGVIDTTTTPAVEAIVVPDSGYNPEVNSPFGRAGTGGTLVPVVPIQNYWGYNTSLWLRKIVQGSGVSDIVLTGYVENAALFYCNKVLVGSVNLDNSQSATISGIPFTITIPAAATVAGANVINVLALDEDESPPNSYDYSQTNDNTYFYCTIASQSYAGASGDMNPSHMIRECLTDADYGMGYQDSDIDDAAFMEAADTLWDEGMGMSLTWDRQMPIEDFIKEIVKHIDAAVYVDRRTGLFTVKLIRFDYDPDALDTLDESNIDRVENFSLAVFGELTNQVTVNYWDSESGTDASLTITDDALAAMEGAVINANMQYPGFTHKALAERVCQRDLRTLSTPLVSCTIYSSRAEASDLTVGSVFKFVWPDYQIHDPVVMRVTGIAYGDGQNNRVRLNCTQDIYSLPETAILAPTPPAWVDPVSDATPATNHIAFEIPYLEGVQQEGQTSIDNELLTAPTIGYVGTAAARPGSALNAKMQSDSGAGYSDASAMDFCPYAELASSIIQVATTLDITNGVDLSSVEVGTWVQCETELMAVVSISSTSLVVKRGVLDTVPVAHNAGAKLFFWDKFLAIDPEEYVSGESVNVRVLTQTGASVLPGASAPVDTVVLGSRAVRPYPPGNFKINGSYFPYSIAATGDIGLTWAHRDRKQQTGSTLTGFPDGNIGPEAGTTYTLRIYGEAGSLVHTYSGSTPSYTYDNTTEASESGLSGGGIGGDSNWANVSFLLLPQGTNGSTTFADSGPGAITVSNIGAGGYPKIVNPAPGSAPAGSAMQIDANGYLRLPDIAALDLGTGDFTFDGWVYFPNVTAEQAIFTCGTSWTAGVVWAWEIRSGGDLRFYAGGGVPCQIFSGAGGITVNTWHWVEVSRASGTIRMFIGGTKVGTDYTGTAINFDNALQPRIGQFFDGTSGLQGTYIAALRVTKGLARHTANYTPPTSLPPTGSGSRLNSSLRFELESTRGGYTSFQKYNVTVYRLGYGLNYGLQYGGYEPSAYGYGLGYGKNYGGN